MFQQAFKNIADAIDDLRSADIVRSAFIGFQKYLYQV